MLRPRRILGTTLLAQFLACDPDVNVEGGAGGTGAEGIGGNGAGSSGGSGATGGGGAGAFGVSGGSGGSGATGGSGGAGGAEPGLVPGCEVLIPNGGPSNLAAQDASSGSIAAFEEDRVLVVFQTYSSSSVNPWRVVSGYVPDPFAGWPPMGSSPMVDHRVGTFSGSVRSRADGAFIVTEDAASVWGGRFGAPGAFLDSSEIARALLEPNGDGYYTLDGDELRFYATLDATEPAQTITLPGPGAEIGADDQDRIVVHAGAELFSLSGEMLVPLSVAPADLYHRTILPRQGGVWYAGKRIPGLEEELRVDVWSVGDEGSTRIQPLGDTEVHDVGFGVWKDAGLAVAAANQSGGGYHLAITDGVNVTRTNVSGAASGYVQSTISVVASPDGASVLVGYLRGSQNEPTFAIQRFDCAPL